MVCHSKSIGDSFVRLSMMFVRINERSRLQRRTLLKLKCDLKFVLGHFGSYQPSDKKYNQYIDMTRCCPDNNSLPNHITLNG